MSIPFRQLIEKTLRRHSRRLGQPEGRHPGRRVVPMIPAEQCEDLPMDFDGLRELKSGFGTAAVIVMDKSTDLVRAIARLSVLLQA
jgi:NADH-quinone oxidoreductase subunit F